MAAHPDDSAKPNNLIGLTDDEIANLDTFDVITLLASIEDIISDKEVDPRTAFQAARLAMFHEQEEAAFDFFHIAAQKGHAGANYYLAHFAEDNETALEHLDIAARDQFADAADIARDIRNEIAVEKARLETERLAQVAAQKAARLVQLKAQQRRQSLSNFSLFNQPKFIKALYQNDQAFLRKNRVDALMYINYMQTVFTDPTVYFRVDQSFELEIDPDLAYNSGVMLASDVEATEKIMGAGMSMIGNIFTSMANTRNSGGSIAQEIAGMNAAIANSQRPFVVYEKGSVQDGKRLLMIYMENPDFFRKVYSGMKNFVYGQ